MTFKTNLSFLLVNTCMNDKYPWNYHKTKQGTIWSQKCCSQSLLDLISLDQNSSNIISLHICIAHFILNSNGFLSNNCSPKWRVFFADVPLKFSHCSVTCCQYVWLHARKEVKLHWLRFNTFFVTAFTLSYFLIHLAGSDSYLANSLAMSGQMYPQRSYR